MGFIRKLWRRHKAKAADRRIFMDQRYVAGSAERDTGLESLRATNNLRDANM
jgi:hypothetical protein